MIMPGRYIQWYFSEATLRRSGRRLAGLELVGGDEWVRRVSHPRVTPSGSEHLCLDLIEFRLGDRAPVEETLGVGDLAGGVARRCCGDGLDVCLLSRLHL